MAFKEYFAGYIEDILKKKRAGQEVFDATDGGKRLRPFMLYSVATALSKDSLAEAKKEILMDFAAGLEFIHAYSLVHDDLPAMDNDDLRRGKATIHKAYSQAKAILCGDSLLNLAFETFSSAALKFKAKYMLEAMQAQKLIADYSGISGMIGGQLLDMTHIEDEKTAKAMVVGKTAALFRAAAGAGAILVGANEEQIKSLDKFAYNYGLLFQLIDDRNDREEDISKEKSSYYNILGPDKAEKMIDGHNNECRRIISDLGIEKKMDYFLNILN